MVKYLRFNKLRPVTELATTSSLAVWGLDADNVWKAVSSCRDA